MEAGQSGGMADGEVSQKFAFDNLDDRDETRDVCRDIFGGSFLAWWWFLLLGGGGGGGGGGGSSSSSRFCVGVLRGIVVWLAPLFFSVWGKEVSVWQCVENKRRVQIILRMMLYQWTFFFFFGSNGNDYGHRTIRARM